MCSRVRGPAIAPSFVTWPIRKTGVPLRLAKNINCAATSCTWLMLPGAENPVELPDLGEEPRFQAGFNLGQRKGSGRRSHGAGTPLPDLGGPLFLHTVPGFALGTASQLARELIPALLAAEGRLGPCHQGVPKRALIIKEPPPKGQSAS